ncbi:pyridoxamine 5'-phosphate oxidase family protein [Alkalihalophilus pseudofirmus]|uniref:Pyridoxamine 5'-phosphate oxidase family protein n=1 Tax=Alkalihalophilus pseudofirmus TaxID=79885 RepID=A0AAJ2NN56_ALKPS|nr:pyridoxamine 5'-phosphate oxidase family protein [Alkalihalophilus pseudofirmus]MDV2885424.1 pyridoxamine 5'-phosphate oxidase family protein [Alkalihalophilus pseudofirmus]WEG15762.1 pyridoxamine 5'-phosphate oxidase family protein [Alkalihalophilus pseudofirmus]
MANQVEHELTNELLPHLQKERYVTLATVDFEKKSPNVNAISWVYAPTNKKLRFAIDNRSRIITNIKDEPGVVLTIIANGSTYSVSGKAMIKSEKMDSVPLKLSLIEVDVEEVRDVMFYGAKIVQNPEYDKTYDAEAAAKLDRQVMEALKTYNNE